MKMVTKFRLRLAAVPTNVVGAGPLEFEVLFALHSAYVARLAAHLLGSDDADVDHVVQDVFWQAWRRLGRRGGGVPVQPGDGKTTRGRREERDR
ncbi:MAG TPA: hypothetical protein VGL59_05045 [Polyangia bacterium]